MEPLDISERVIEDVLIADKSIIAGILEIDPADLDLLARQKIVVSGKIDMLFIHRDEIILIELKVTPFYNAIIQQINEYYEDLVNLQNQNRLVKSPIRKVILVTDCQFKDEDLCKSESIDIITYKPKDVLSSYYENFKEVSYFLKVQPGDFGVTRLGLFKSTLNKISEGIKLNDVAKLENRSIKTIRNRVSVAMRLNLVAKHREEYYLTEMGEVFNSYSDEVDDRLSIEQSDLLQAFIRENPFYSSITYTILGLIESVFILAKNYHPVPEDQVKEHFVQSVGKISTWAREKSKSTATYIFSNYAIELNFLTRLNNHLFLAPAGINAILLLQLHRSIKLIEQKEN